MTTTRSEGEKEEGKEKGIEKNDSEDSLYSLSIDLNVTQKDSKIEAQIKDKDKVWGSITLSRGNLNDWYVTIDNHLTNQKKNESVNDISSFKKLEEIVRNKANALKDELLIMMKKNRDRNNEDNSLASKLTKCVNLAAKGTTGDDKPVEGDDNYLGWMKKHVINKFGHFAHNEKGKERVINLVLKLRHPDVKDNVDKIKEHIRDVYMLSYANPHSFSRFLFWAFQPPSADLSLKKIQQLPAHSLFGISFSDLKHLSLFSQEMTEDTFIEANKFYENHKRGIRSLWRTSKDSQNAMSDLFTATSDEDRYTKAMAHIVNHPNTAYAKCLLKAMIKYPKPQEENEAAGPSQTVAGTYFHGKN